MKLLFHRFIFTFTVLSVTGCSTNSLRKKDAAKDAAGLRNPASVTSALKTPLSKTSCSELTLLADVLSCEYIVQSLELLADRPLTIETFEHESYSEVKVSYLELHRADLLGPAGVTFLALKKMALEIHFRLSQKTMGPNFDPSDYRPMLLSIQPGAEE